MNRQIADWADKYKNLEEESEEKFRLNDEEWAEKYK